jgi:hypothetical protein
MKINAILICFFVLALQFPCQSIASPIDTIKYQFKLNSSEVVVRKNNEKPAIYQMLYPIILDKDSNRAGIYGELFFCMPECIITNIVADIDQDYQYNKTWYHLHPPKEYSTVLTIVCPNEDAILEIENQNGEVTTTEIHLPFSPYFKSIEEPVGKIGILPLRIIFENLHHKVDWNPDTQEITVTYPATETEE